VLSYVFVLNIRGGGYSAFIAGIKNRILINQSHNDLGAEHRGSQTVTKAETRRIVLTRNSYA